MWQVLLAAAVAGSGYFAKQLLNTNTPQPINISQQNDQKSDHIEKLQPSNHQDSTQVGDCGNTNAEAEISAFDDESIFRFCSDSGSRSGSKNSKKKSVGGCKVIRGNVGKVDKKCGLVEDHRKSGRKFAVCLKKRRTSKNACAKCESCDPKGKSSFGYGVSMGIMYMMSAGKVEISRLNTAMDVTAKVVQELKTELAKRKSSRNLNVTNSITQDTASPRKTQINVKSISDHGDGLEKCGIHVSDEVEYASSVLTEDPQPELLEMTQLEAELESELLKLPGPTTETSCRDKGISSSFKNEVSAEDFSKLDGFNLGLYQSNGVLASELDQKLSHLLIEQQESHIVELESKLRRTNSKLCEKEAELQALKECVKRLTEFSLANASDDEIEAQADEEKTREVAHDNMECDSRKSAIGIKRAMDFEPYGCCTY